MGVLLWILFGILAGSMAKLVMDGPSAGGMAVAIPVGVGGAVVGGLIGTFCLGEKMPGFDFRSLMMAVSGSLFLLFCYRCNALRATA